MKKSIYFRGRDARAVENPYDAVFKLAEKLGNLSKMIMLELTILLLIMILHFRSIVDSIEDNLSTWSPGPLNYIAVVLAIPLLIITAVIIFRLIKSLMAIQHFRKQYKLLNKICETFTILKKDLKKSESKYKKTPQEALIALIQNISNHFNVFVKTFIAILVLFGVFFLNIIILSFIYFSHYGSIFLNKGTVDLDIPGGLPSILLFIQIIIMLVLFFQFRFIKCRFSAIDHSMKHQPTNIPKGKDPHTRYKNYLVEQNMYPALKNIAKWEEDDYFNLKSHHKKGWIFVKSLDGAPTSEELLQFRENCLKKRDRGKIERAIIVYPENTEKPLSEEVYNSVIKTPIRTSRDICNIQLVEESNDGTYDFIPFIPFEMITERKGGYFFI